MNAVFTSGWEVGAVHALEEALESLRRDRAPNLFLKSVPAGGGRPLTTADLVVPHAGTGSLPALSRSPEPGLPALAPTPDSRHPASDAADRCDVAVRWPPLRGDRRIGEGAKKGRYTYYRCAGTKGCKRFYPEKLLESETLRLLSSLQIDEAVSEWLLAEIEKLHDQGMDAATLKRLVSRRKALQGLQAQAYEDKLLGKIDEAFWAERNAAWQAELTEINGELQTIENAPSKADLLAGARTGEWWS